MTSPPPIPRPGDPLPQSLLREGQKVAFNSGECCETDSFTPDGQPKVLYSGHPGVITDPPPQHILVDWFGLEDDVWSFAFGFTAMGTDLPIVGLTAIGEDEYSARCKAIEQGNPPT